MRKFLFTTLAILSGYASAGEPSVRNLAPDFVAAYDATAQLPMPERVAAMKKALVAIYPEFYGRGTESQQDQRIQSAIETFPKLRETYLEQTAKFGDAIRQHLATYSSHFPRFRLTVPTSLVHSLGEMNGGTRDIGPDGAQHLIFGADMIAALDPMGNPAPLFHHELFHVMHEERFSCDKGAMWSSLWKEGLAVHVSDVMNPGSNAKELLLDYPRGMPEATRAQLPAAWKQLASVLDSTDKSMYRELFMMSGKGGELPARRGYYLGYLVAREAGKTRDLSSLAALDCAESRALVEATIRKLSTEGMP